MRRLPLLVAALVVAVAAWLVLRPDSASTRDAATVDDGVSAQQRPPALADLDGPAAAVRREPEAPSPPSATSGAAADAEVLPPSDDPSALLVRCVDRDSGAPLAGALVYRLDQSGADEEAAMRAMMTGTSIPDMIARLGDTYRAGAEGQVRIPHGDDLAIAARHGDKFRVRLVMEPAPGEVIALDLFRQPRFAVEVVGEDGTPRPGADVAMRMFWDIWRFDVQVQEAGQDGVARFADFATLLESAVGETLYAGLAETLPAPVETEIPAGLFEDLDAPPLRLVMPATGTVEIEVLDHLGQPCRDGVVVRLVVDEPGNDDEELGGGDGRASTALTRDGVACFDYVGLGLALRAAAYLNGPSVPSEARGAGPTAAGEQVRLRIDEDLRGSGAFGQLTLDGRPFADRDLHLTLRRRTAANTWEDSFFLRSDAQGRFRAQFRPPMSDEIPGRELFLEGEQDGVALLARAELTSEQGAGFQDLGTLRLAAAPLLVAGRVLDAAGEPLHGADVAVEGQVHWGDDPAQTWWVELPGLDADSDADGTFRIAGLPPHNPRVRVLATHPEGLPTRAEIDVGAEDLVLRLAAAGIVEGSILASEGFPLGRLEVSVEYTPPLLPEDTEDVLLWDDIDPVSRDFRLVGLPPGIASLVVVDDDNGLELVRLEGIRIGPGLTPDARLQPLDLRERAFAHRIEVRDATGAALDDVEMAATTSLRHAVTSEDGSAMLLTTTSRCDVALAATGFRTHVESGVQGSAEVVMRRGVPLVFEWPGGPPADGREWVVRFLPGDGQPAWTTSRWAEFDADGIAEVLLPAAGEWRIRYSVYGEDGVHAYFTGADGDRWRLQVADAIAPQRILADLDAAAVERAARALDKARAEDG